MHATVNDRDASAHSALVGSAHHPVLSATRFVSSRDAHVIALHSFVTSSSLVAVSTLLFRTRSFSC
jgi:hypothetical protein